MKKAGDLLSSFMDERVLKNAQGYSELFNSWASIAGESAACHSRVRELERSILLVEADHPGWIQILQTRQSELLKAVRRRFPDLSIAGISFCLCRDPLSFAAPRDKTAPDAAEPDKPDPETTANVRKKTAELYETIEDGNFKDALKRLERSIHEKTKKGK
ncbi:DUF721 domain-containing protein [Breznakiella homolactica]|uniref:DUF721 domain-containing protein n=1 Tax=Breznakiella homolactica TaxID=2798577 RepID=A0A7T7XPC7_9SPIR|nr:DUF721 domain-containing protein [Breznakiella homolactica]QQO10013.1 DUF721 domain-containing protein [Breznakiella homolactica]